MDLTMRIMLSCLLSFIAVTERKMDVLVVAAGQSEKSNNLEKQYEAIFHDLSHNRKSVLTTSGSVEVASDVLKETNKQELLLPSQSLIEEATFVENVNVSPELTTTAEIVFPSTDAAKELKSIIKKPQLQDEVRNDSLESPSTLGDNREFDVKQEFKTDRMLEEMPSIGVNESDTGSISSQDESTKAAPQHEDIPSFSEWTQKQLAEAEKKKMDQNETIDRFTKPRGKFRNKNYASPDCGAKIVAANPESLRSSSVLSSLKDEYMLNYCTNRIWFVVELCEAIQAKQLDLANFELFSSSPKHFSVFLSHRFPTREWSNVGKFTAEDSRDIQTFNLYPHLFGKFVKVEMHSHYGREQFCPISWVRIYGTSEYEVLAKEDERNSLAEDDDGDPYDEDVFVGHKRDSPKNLFSSATDAVLSIVKKATAPFMKSENNETEIKTSEEPGNTKTSNCISPRYITVCNNCSQNLYDSVFDHLSCQFANLESLLSNAFIKRSLVHSEICAQFGLDFSKMKGGAPFPYNFLKNSQPGLKYLTAMLKNFFLAALCNVLAVVENKVVVNTTMESLHSLKNLTEENKYCDEVKTSATLITSTSTFEDECVNPLSTDFEARSDSATTSSFPAEVSSVFEKTVKSSDNAEKIEPTRTLSEDEMKLLPASNAHFDSSVKISSEEKSTELAANGYVSPTVIISGDESGSNSSAKKEEPKVASAVMKGEPARDQELENANPNNATNNDTTLESIISDINAIERVVNSPSNPASTSSPNLPTESIFLRLANRIKNLEINMSLSSTYLEELSRRYRMQLELLSKTLNVTAQKVEEHSKLEEERERRREKEMLLIRMQLANLTRDLSAFVSEKNSWKPQAASVSQHIVFISLEILFAWIVFNYWKRPSKSLEETTAVERKINRKCRRRNSLEGVKGHETPRRKTRRPSDEALDIALSRNFHKKDSARVDKKKKKRKKDSRCSLNGVHMGKRKVSEAEVPGGDATEPVTDVAPRTEASKSESIPWRAPVTERNLQVFSRLGHIAGMDSSSVGGNSVAKCDVQSFASPTFMKTALAARNSRLHVGFDKDASLDREKKDTQKEKKSSNSLKKYMRKFF